MRRHVVKYCEELVELSKILLVEDAYEDVARQLLARVVEVTGAGSGFLVVREESRSYQLHFEAGRDQEGLSEVERRFSSSLVRRTIRTARQLYIANLVEDPRFAGTESADTIGPCSVLVTPLLQEEEVFGVLYLENRKRIDSFHVDDRSFLGQFAEMASLFLLRSLERERLIEKNRILERDLLARYDFDGIVTHHPKMIALLKVVAQVAAAEVPVLILGESGTGKELIARAIHVNSPRRRGPLATVHCGALSPTLLESELFGHVRGAFTGARRERRGRLAAAENGTLFLDEIGEASLEVQAKLLRFLQFGEIQRVGSDRTERTSTRVIAATHRDLHQMRQRGEFREDLYYRLKVLELTVPPLRERASDVPLLVEHFLDRFWPYEGDRPRFSRRAQRRLAAYDYPGNVRELAHLVERACVLARGPGLDVDLLPPELDIQPGASSETALTTLLDQNAEIEAPNLEKLTVDSLKAAREAAVAKVESRFLEALMELHGGNVSQAARHSGIHRTYLHKLLARYPQAFDR